MYASREGCFTPSACLSTCNLADHIPSLRAFNTLKRSHMPDVLRTSCKNPDKIISEQLRPELLIFFKHLENEFLIVHEEFTALQVRFWNEIQYFWMKYSSDDFIRQAFLWAYVIRYTPNYPSWTIVRVASLFWEKSQILLRLGWLVTLAIICIVLVMLIERVVIRASGLTLGATSIPRKGPGFTKWCILQT